MKSFVDMTQDFVDGKDDMGKIFFRARSKTELKKHTPREGNVIVHVTGPNNPGEYWIVTKAYATMLTTYGNNNTIIED